MKERPESDLLHRQPAAAFVQAFKALAKQPRPMPAYIPESLHGWLLRAKTRHSFNQESK